MPPVKFLRRYLPRADDYPEIQSVAVLPNGKMLTRTTKIAPLLWTTDTIENAFVKMERLLEKEIEHASYESTEDARGADGADELPGSVNEEGPTP